jgi:coenzyme F420-dependent glucose-6-phosphate dehydrogenase
LAAQPKIGYALSSEEHNPVDLVRYARMAEDRGFTFALISDHFHPWTDRQGQSPFVWTVIGAIAQATQRLRLGTGVTCPLIRTHPAVIAHASATASVLMPGRFFLGLGTGENLNEHVLGDRWPEGQVRFEMLTEAIEIIRLLWQGGYQSHHGQYYTVEQARLYTLPDDPPPIMVAADKPNAAKLAAIAGDGFIGTAPDEELISEFEAAGGADKSRIGQLTVCWANDEETAIQTALEWWPNAAAPGELGQELALPRHFEQVAKLVSGEDIAAKVVCSPDPAAHQAAIQEFADAGYDHVYVHQVGPDQEGFLDFYGREILA